MNIELQVANDGDSEFAYRVKQQALGPFIEARWGWHEDYQRSVHERDWQQKPWSIILLDGAAGGTVSIDRREKVVRLGGFYLAPDQQNRGVGSAVLDKILYLCDRDRRDCQVSITEGNRAITLFKRHGFREVGRDDDHIQLLRNWRFP